MIAVLAVLAVLATLTALRATNPGWTHNAHLRLNQPAPSKLRQDAERRAWLAALPPLDTERSGDL